MRHYFEKTIVEAKNIYTDFLTYKLSQLLYEGFQALYEDSIALEQKYTIAEQSHPDVKNPGIIPIFQLFLKSFDNLNNSLIDTETARIRDNSGCADIFDDLIKAVIKSHIVVLTYMGGEKQSEIVERKLHEKIETKFFIHKCYIECARIFYDHANLFWHKFDKNIVENNQRIIFQLIKIGIKNAIKLVLPMKEILEEYLNNDYVEENDDEKYLKIKQMLNNKDDEGGRMKIVNSTMSDTNVELLKIEQDIDDLRKELVYNRNFDDTFDELKDDVAIKVDIIKPDKTDTVKTDKAEVIKPESFGNIKGGSNEKTEKQNDVVTENVKQSAGSVMSAKETKKSYSEIEKDFYKQYEGGKKKNISQQILLDEIQKVHGSEKNDSNKINIIKGKINKIDDKDNYFEELEK